MFDKEIYKNEECYLNFTSKNWNKLSDEKRRESLQELENYMAKKQGRESPRIVKDEKLNEGVYGEFRRNNPEYLYIDLEQLQHENGYMAIKVTVHEGRHGYQYDVVNGDVQDNSVSEKKRQAWGKNFICYSDSGQGVDYRSQSLENDAFSYTDEVLLNEFKEKFDKIDSKAYKSFLKEQEKLYVKYEKEALKYFNVNNRDQILEKSLENQNGKFERMRNDAEIKVEVIERLKNQGRPAWELKVEQEEFKAKYNMDPEEALRQIEAFEHGDGVAIKDKDTLQKDMSYNLKISSISLEKQLDDLQKEYSPKNKELQSLKYEISNAEKRLTEYYDNLEKINEIKRNRKKIPNADNQIKQLENSSQKVHEFFKREYNVEPEKAQKIIDEKKGQAESMERKLKPMEEKIKMLKEQQMERRIADSQTKDNMTKSYDRLR